MVSVDRNLLFGILALQMDFVERDALIAAMHAWVLHKDQPLGEILVQQQTLAEDERRVLDSLVEKHLARHGGDPQRSLAAVASETGVQTALDSVADFDVQASLAQFAKARTQGNRQIDLLSETLGIGASTAPGAGGSDGRFRLLRLHDRGGLGEVFVALDRELNREVALKQMQEQHADDPQLRARFVVEAEVTGGLEHPGIVPVYGLGTYANGRPFYAMRFIRGDNLKLAVERFHADPELMHDEGKRTLERRRLLGRFLDVCNAVAYAHSRGVLHRDLKPGNIMLGKYGETLLVDWGLAKSVRRSEPALDLSERTFAPGSGSDVQPTEFGSRVGTPAYMSPEQAAGRLDHLGPASDVYSLGATLYFVLSGKPPFQQEADIVELLRKVEHGEFPPPSQINPRVDGALDAICKKAMALDPKDRYASVRELAEEIEHWLADEPVSAWREPRRRRFERWVRRHKPLVAGLASLVIVGLIALAVGTILLRNANLRVQEQRDVANGQRDLASRQRDLANENFQQARQAVEIFLTSVSEERLLNQPGLQPLRKTLLRSALDYYQDFVRQRADDPTLRRQLADAYRRLGEINGELGNLSEGIAALEQAVGIFEPLRGSAPADSELSIALARALQGLGYWRLRHDEADPGERAVRSAIELLEPLERDHPEIAEYGRRLGRCYDLIGVVGIVRGRDAQYLPYWDKAVAVFERTIARHPDDLEARASVVMALNNQGSALEGVDNVEGGLKSCRQAAEQGRQLQKLAPEKPVAGFETATSLNFLTSEGILSGLFQSAEQTGAASVESFRSVSFASPGVPLNRRWLIRSLALRALALVRLGHQARAALTIHEAQALLEEMGPQAFLDRFDRERIATLQLAQGILMADQGRWTEVVPVFEANLRRSEALFFESSGQWILFCSVIDGRAALVEARLRAGRISLTEAITALAQVLVETESDSHRLDRPSIRVARAEVLFRQAALQAEAGNVAEAFSTLERAVAPLESETASHPQRLHWKLALARAVSLRGELHHKANRGSQALADARHAVELVEPTISEGSGYLYELGAFQTAYRDLAESSGNSEAKKSAPDLRACLDTLKKAVTAGFDNAIRLRQDPRLKLLRELLKPELDGLVASAVAAGKAPN